MSSLVEWVRKRLDSEGASLLGILVAFAPLLILISLSKLLRWTEPWQMIALIVVGLVAWGLFTRSKSHEEWLIKAWIASFGSAFLSVLLALAGLFRLGITDAEEDSNAIILASCAFVVAFLILPLIHVHYRMQKMMPTRED